MLLRGVVAPQHVLPHVVGRSHGPRVAEPAPEAVVPLLDAVLDPAFLKPCCLL